MVSYPFAKATEGKIFVISDLVGERWREDDKGSIATNYLEDFPLALVTSMIRALCCEFECNVHTSSMPFFNI